MPEISHLPSILVRAIVTVVYLSPFFSVAVTLAAVSVSRRCQALGIVATQPSVAVAGELARSALCDGGGASVARSGVGGGARFAAPV